MGDPLDLSHDVHKHHTFRRLGRNDIWTFRSAGSVTNSETLTMTVIRV